jgi:hypothetical protein
MHLKGKQSPSTLAGQQDDKMEQRTYSSTTHQADKCDSSLPSGGGQVAFAGHAAKQYSTGYDTVSTATDTLFLCLNGTCQSIQLSTSTQSTVLAATLPLPALKLQPSLLQSSTCYKYHDLTYS